MSWRAAVTTEPPRLAVVLPVGPGTEPTFVADTIDAVTHYAATPPRVVLVDDSGAGVAAHAARGRATDGDLDITVTAGNGPDGGRYLTLSQGFARALEQPFDILLRLDPDATVIGRGWDSTAWRQLRESPTLAVLGSHLLTYDATARDLRPVQTALVRATSRRTLVSAPGQRALLRRLLAEADDHGYQRGEHVAGGICVYSRSAITRLRDADLLARPELARAPLGEDHVFGLLLSSLGLAFRQFGTRFDALPCATGGPGLPDSPEALLAAGKSLVHSTRFSGTRHEAAVREVFAAHRRREASEARAGVSVVLPEYASLPPARRPTD